MRTFYGATQIPRTIHKRPKQMGNPMFHYIRTELTDADLRLPKGQQQAKRRALAVSFRSLPPLAKAQWHIIFTSCNVIHIVGFSLELHWL